MGKCERQFLPFGGPRGQRLFAARSAVFRDAAQDATSRLLQRLRKPGESPHTWWAVGRIGARVPFYGSAHHVIDRKIVVHWLDELLKLDWRSISPAAFAATLLARVSGDRERDLEEPIRAEVVQRLRSAKAPTSWVQMVQEMTELDEASEQLAFGESLPPGLRLLH